MNRSVRQIPFLLGISLGCLLFSSIVLAFPSRCQAKEIAVELVWKFGQTGWIQVTIEEGEYTLTVENLLVVKSTSTPMLGEAVPGILRSGTVIQLGWGGWTPVWRIGQGDFSILRASGLRITSPKGSFNVKDPEGQSVTYRGGLEIKWLGDRWQLVNHVDAEDYLKGVVPIEMSNNWVPKGLEALKAQAVAARTYMVKHLASGKKLTDSPDIDQAYLGKNVEGSATLAVATTYGKILVDSASHDPIKAYYSSHSGGFTEDAQNVWGNKDVHHTSHSDYFSRGMGGALDDWRFIISAVNLGKKFGLGPVRKIELDKFLSGRVKKVRIEDWYGDVQEVSGKAFVKKFYPFDKGIGAQAFLGSLFEVSFIETGEPEKELIFSPGQPTRLRGLAKAQGSYGPRLARIISSAEGISSAPQPFGVYIFSGRGWGHGVGMSQWGAYHMAQMGYSYEDILLFYYDRVEIMNAW